MMSYAIKPRQATGTLFPATKSNTPSLSTQAQVVFPLDRSDPRVVAAQQAEENLLQYYNLRAQSHEVELAYPSMRVRVVEIGEGEPVLLVPGGVGDGYVFLPLIAHLTRRRYIVINRPGGGLSDGIDHHQVDLRR